METSTEIAQGDITMLIGEMDRDRLAGLALHGRKGGEFLAQFLFVRDPNYLQRDERRAQLAASLEISKSQNWSKATILAMESQLEQLDAMVPMISAWNIASRHRLVTGTQELQKAVHSLIGQNSEECRKGNGRILTALVQFADARRARKAVADARGADSSAAEDAAHAYFIRLGVELNGLLTLGVQDILRSALQPTAGQRRTSSSSSLTALQ